MNLEEFKNYLLQENLQELSEFLSRQDPKQLQELYKSLEPDHDYKILESFFPSYNQSGYWKDSKKSYHLFAIIAAYGSCGHLEIFFQSCQSKDILEDIKKDNYLALRYAAHVGNLAVIEKIVDFLEKQGQHLPEENLSSILCEAAAQNHFNIIELFLTRSNDPSGIINKVIHETAKQKFFYNRYKKKKAMNALFDLAIQHNLIFNCYFEQESDVYAFADLLEVIVFKKNLNLLNHLIEHKSKLVYLSLYSERNSIWELAFEDPSLTQALLKCYLSTNVDSYEVVRFINSPQASLRRKILNLACQNGCLGIVNQLFEKKKFSFSDIKDGLESAIKNKHPRIVNRLLEYPGVKTKKAGSDLNQAIKEGNLDEVKRLLKLKRYSIFSLLAPDYNENIHIKTAVSHNQWEIVQYLLSFFSVKISLFRLRHFPSEWKFEPDCYWEKLFEEACKNNQLLIVNQLLTLKDSWFFGSKNPSIVDILKNAIQQDQIQIVKLLLNRYAFQLEQEQLITIFKLSVFAGKTEIVELFSGHLPEQIQWDILKAIFSCNGHPPASWGYYYCTQPPHWRNYGYIQPQKLLCYPIVFDYADSYSREYGAMVTNFLSEKITYFKSEEENFKKSHPNEIFNLSNSEAKLGFYFLKAYIRKHSYARTTYKQQKIETNIKWLMQVPSIRELLHTSVLNPDYHNQLLQIAQLYSCAFAADLLLEVDAVRELAVQNNYYQRYNNGLTSIDLRDIAQDKESSLRALSQEEQKQLESALKKYRPEIQQKGGISSAFEQMKAEIAQYYQSHPAKIKTWFSEYTLPLTWEEFQELPIRSSKKAKEAYYRDPWHTAWRYLSKPNPWIDPDARYSHSSKLHADFEGYQELLIVCWLAVKDINVKSTNEYTVESRIENFIREIALIGRAHNWDKTRIRTIKGKRIEEEYDDLLPDNPSCYSGAKKRIYQSVQGHPLFSMLTLEMIQQRLANFVQDYFKTQINSKNIVSLHAAWKGLIAGNNIDKTTLATLNIPVEKQTEFIRSFSEEYSLQFDENPYFIAAIKERFNRNEGLHAMTFGGEETHLTDLLEKKLSEEKLKEIFSEINTHEFKLYRPYEKRNDRFLSKGATQIYDLIKPLENPITAKTMDSKNVVRKIKKITQKKIGSNLYGFWCGRQQSTYDLYRRIEQNLDSIRIQ